MPLSPRAVAAALAPETDEREVYLITLTHESWDAPIRLSTDQTVWLRNDERSGTPMYGTISRGEMYEYVPISASLPDSRDESPPVCSISISNVSRLVSPYLLMVDKKYPRASIEIVLASEPDIVDQTWPELDLNSGDMDANNVQIELGMNIASNEPMPWLRFVYAYFPNLYERNR